MAPVHWVKSSNAFWYFASSGATMPVYTPTDLPVRSPYSALAASHQPLSAGRGPAASAALVAADVPAALVAALVAAALVVPLLVELLLHADSTSASALTPAMAAVRLVLVAL